MNDCIDITDKTRKPDMSEICDYIDNPLFMELCCHLTSEYGALYSIDYSGDSNLAGWNLRYYKSGRTLCRMYPRRGYFSVLVVIGRREAERVAELLSGMSDEMREIYENTKEGMGQRWLIYDLHEDCALYNDTKTLINIRRNS